MAPDLNAINSILLGLSSSVLKTRTAALEDITTFFERSKNGPILPDKQYQRIIDDLFKCLRSEKDASNRKSGGAGTAGLGRISKYAKAIRLTWEHTKGSLKRKTLVNLVHETLDILQDAEGALVALPNLTSDLLRTFLSILSIPSKTEQLTSDGAEAWQRGVEFCVEVITNGLESGEDQLPRTGRGVSVTPMGVSGLMGNRVALQGTGLNVTDLQQVLECLHMLLLPSTAPVKIVAGQIIKAMLSVLQLRHLIFGRIPQDVFCVLSIVLRRTQADNAKLTTNSTRMILPHISHWWQADRPEKEETVKCGRDEILKTVFAMRLHLHRLSLDDADDVFRGEVKDLLSTLWTEYSRRDDKSRLHIGDIAFHSGHLSNDHFQNPLFSLYYRGNGEDRNWVILETIAILEELLHLCSKNLASEDQDDDGHLSKRRRIIETNRIYQRLQSPDIGIKITALQLVPFLSQSEIFSDEDIWILLQQASLFVRHKSSTLSSWAMIACASCLLRDGADDESLFGHWKNLWQTAVRTVTIPGTCRASCALLLIILEREILPYHQISQEISRMITSPDFNGPVVLVDSSLHLMLHLLHLRNVQVPNASEQTSSQVIRWNFMKWHPADITFAAAHSPHTFPHDICSLLRACCGLKGIPLPVIASPGGPLSQAWREQQPYQECTRYLLALNEPKTLRTWNQLITQRYQSVSAQPSDPMSSHLACNLILESLTPKLRDLEEMVELWGKKLSEGGRLLHAESVQCLVSTCLSLAMMLPSLEDAGLPIETARGDIKSLLDITYKTIKDSRDTQSFVNVIARTLQPYIPFLSVSKLSDFHDEQPQVFNLMRGAYRAFMKSSSSRSNASVDAMDIDDDFGGGVGKMSAGDEDNYIPRFDSEIGLRESSFFTDIRTRLAYMYFVFPDDDISDNFPTKMTELLVNLPNSNFLAASNAIVEILGSDIKIDSRDAADIVEKAGSIMSMPQFELCEVAIMMAMRIVEALAAVWQTDRSDLHSMVGDLYHHFVKTGVQLNMLSQAAQIRLIDLFLLLMQELPEWAERQDLPECSISLLKLLDHAGMTVKFYIGSKLPDIFDFSPLPEHDRIFLDVHGALPVDTEDDEGIAFRLYAFAQIACRWPNLRRRCIYHIFETASEIPSGIRYATRVLKRISDIVGLASPRDLFQLFAPQIIYTWVLENNLKDICYSIFGYISLHELLECVQEEVTAILVMRGDSDMFEEFARTLDRAPVDLVQEHFGRTIAYCIGHSSKAKKRFVADDSIVSDSGPSESQGAGAGELYLRKLLGQKLFIECVGGGFAEAVSVLMGAFDQEFAMETIFQKELSYAGDILNEIKGYARTEILLPPNQQPCFKGKYLILQLDRLCQLMPQYDLLNLWTPPLVTYVARKLINTVSLTLGSAHACSVVRKLQILVCLAGQQAASQYPLEMLLQSLRKFTIYLECADDALSLSRYLIAHGIKYLKTVPSFLAGYGLSTLTSLRVFMETKPRHIRQDGHFNNIMEQVESFHAWLCENLRRYADEGQFTDDHQKQTFSAIVTSVSKIKSSGNAERGTPESSLLREIIHDERRRNQLLSKPARDLALGILCQDFQMPEQSKDDIISTDFDAIKLSSVIWQSCSSKALSKNYLAWAGRVVGRSFAASGHVSDRFLNESNLPEYINLTLNNCDSIQGLLSLLSQLTDDESSETVGLAEGAIRQIVTDAQATPDLELQKLCQDTLANSLYNSSGWEDYYPPATESSMVVSRMDHNVFNPEAIEQPDWVQRMAFYLCLSADDMVVVSAVAPVVKGARGFAERAFPFILHLVLLSQMARDQDQIIRQIFSGAIKVWLANLVKPKTKANISLILNSILYLRTQQPPNGMSMVDRMKWLDVDPVELAQSGVQCGLYKSSLMFIEGMLDNPVTTSARELTSFVVTRAVEVPPQTLVDIFEHIDDPDAFYGLPRPPSLNTAISLMEYEGDGGKSLAFRGAIYDSNLRRKDAESLHDTYALVNALGNLGLSGVASSLLQSQSGGAETAASLDSTFKTARKLEQWNLPVPTTSTSPEVTIYKAFQGLYQTTDLQTAKWCVQEGFAEAMQLVVKPGNSAVSLRGHLRSLAVLTELDDFLNVKSAPAASELLSRFRSHEQWMKSGRYEDVSSILSCRATACSLFSQLPVLQNVTQITPADARLVEVNTLIAASRVYQFHKARQEALNLTTTLTALEKPCRQLGINIDIAAKIEAATSLWDHGEMLSSIGILKNIMNGVMDGQIELNDQSISISMADILSRLGQRVSAARLESPDDIQHNYLEAALKYLDGHFQGEDAGKVFHQFAMFCDEQLQNPDILEDLERLKELEKGKAEEVEELQKLVVSAKDASHKRRYTAYLDRAKRLHSLDQLETKRVEDTRTEFMRLSIENYLLSLAASDDHDNDALRFAALWLERADDEATNQAAEKHLSKVPSRKFATLMNQLSSRLQNDRSMFQKLLWFLIQRICTEHPYHGMYHIWSGTKTVIVNRHDLVAVSRRDATIEMGKELAQEIRTTNIWHCIDRTSRAYEHLAGESTERYKTGQKIQLRHSASSMKLMQALSRYPIPPPTMYLAVRADCDYSKTPMIASLEPTMSIAGGNSAPKIITALGTDGCRYKQLVKGGNDDLRQDAIMEQVFDSVSSLLKGHRATQRRKLTIRTYKVLPLTPTSGIIEFVANTIPLHEFLMPAHQRYYPKDMRGNQCRKEISQVERGSTKERVAVFRRIMERFHPVMRFFFMEHFQDPDAWFQKRVAYTRTTAAISMVGHVLGLGDRHGHNILMDTVTGEVVHIDLGVAFELGRVLPIPEVVPFRLTRDIVDGFGVTKTEGVFRRCCEYTLDALREETYSIMTILDVLRYDPLYSWSMSPVRVAKLQNAPKEEQDAVDSDAGDIGADGRKKRGLENEAHEAQRALAIVRKKLSKTLSVEATVNDLINQATDPRNLAVLFAGWGAYA